MPTTGPNLRSRGEKPPVEPVAATQHTPEGAKAFAEFFIKTIDWGFATMSGAYIRHYASSDCVGCAQFADGVDRAKAKGNRYIGGRFSVKAVNVAQYSSTSATLLVTYDALSFEELDSDQHGVSADPARTNQRFQVVARWTLGWRAADLAVYK